MVEEICAEVIVKVYIDPSGYMFYFRDFSKPEPPGGYWENLKIKTIGVMDACTFDMTKNSRKLYAWGQKIPYVDYENHPSYKEGQAITIAFGGKAASLKEANLKKLGTSEGLGNWEIAKSNGNIGKTEIIPKNNVINVRNNKIKQVNKEFGKKGTKPKKEEAKGKDDAHFGENNNKPETGKTVGKRNTKIDGAGRAEKYQNYWREASLKDTVKKIASDNPIVEYTNTGKILYKNPTDGMQVVYDTKGNYFRIENTKVLKGRGVYTDITGKPVIENVLLIKKEKNVSTGLPKDVWQSLTHFKNID